MYRQENYIEAIRYLEEARKEDPDSSSAAFFLGLTFKQLMDHQKALEHLRDAVTLTPPIKEALVELVGVLYELDKLKEAEKWIEVAERDDIIPAKIAFLKGLILRKRGKPTEAAEAFEKVKTLDEGLSQSADIQIALCNIENKKFKAASDVLKAAIQRAPGSDLAGFARQYQSLLEKRIEAERPLRLTLNASHQYDTNVVLKPLDETLAPNITDEESRVSTTNLIVDYLPALKGPWLFNAQYAFNGNFHDKFIHTHDSISNSLYLAPGYNFGKSALNLSTRYVHSLVRSPSYKKYLGSLEVGPLYRQLLTENQIAEVFGGFTQKDYFQPVLDPDEDRDSLGWHFYTSYVWIPKAGAFFNLRIEMGNDNTEGVNWKNLFKGASISTTIPLTPKLELQLSGQVYSQDFRHPNTFFLVTRNDTNYTGTVGLSWEFFKNTNLLLQFTPTRVNSTIPIYEYERELYSLGIEFRY